MEEESKGKFVINDEAGKWPKDMTMENHLPAFPKTAMESYRMVIMDMSNGTQVSMQHDPLYDGPLPEQFKRRSTEWLTGKVS